MPQSDVNPVYLPLTRDLNYQTNFIVNGDIIETQTGDIIPITTADMPTSKVFEVTKASVTERELSMVQNFYETYYLQKFRFMDKKNAQKTLVTLEIANGILTEFNLHNKVPHLVYLINSAKIYNNNQLVTNAIINNDLQINFVTAPSNNSVITAIIDYDYAVMFDYDFGLQSEFDAKMQIYKISFQLITQL